MSGGTRPEDWQAHSDQITSDQRARAVVDWLRRPAAERPRFVTVYFSAVDTAGHQLGPEPPVRHRRSRASMRRSGGCSIPSWPWVNPPTSSSSRIMAWRRC
ncbi:alkaline phosphatase family protein [Sphingomonas sp. MMS24-JH45]